MSNEKIIRSLCKQLFTKKYPNSVIVDEFTCDSLCTRNDLFVVDNSSDVVLSIEIKSDRDTLKRLKSQVSDYKTYSNIVYVVLDIKHLKKYLTWIDLPEFKDVGLLIYDNGKMFLKQSAVVKDFPSLFKLMRTNELKVFTTGLKGRSKLQSNRLCLTKMIKKIFTKDEYNQIARSLFMNRIGKPYNPKPTIDNNIAPLILKKQSLFTSYIKGIL